MRLAISSLFVVGFTIATCTGSRPDYRLLDPATTGSISGKCYSTYPAGICPDINQSCAATVCPGNSCPAATEGHSSSAFAVPQCADTGPNGDTACGTGYSYACGYTMPCGTTCFPASNGKSYCNGPAQVQTPAYIYRGNESNGISCPQIAPSGSMTASVQPMDIPDSLRVIASFNGSDYNPFQ